MPDAATALANLVRSEIAAAGDADKAPRMQAYMKSAMPYRGVSSAPLASLLRPLLRDHELADRAQWEGCVHLLWDDAGFREERYAAVALARHRPYARYRDPGALPLYRHLVVTGAWWDHVDTVTTRLVGPLLSGHPDELTPVVREWATDDDLWLRRTALIAQLHRREHTDTALLRDCIEANLAGSLHGGEFFVRKAIGWALRQHARVDPEWVRRFVAEHQEGLSGLSRREALRHL